MVAEKFVISAALAILVLTGTPGFAQQGNNGTSSPNAGQGMQGQGHMGMDMQAMARQCAAARQQVQKNPSQPRSADLQRTIAQCDQMDKMMGGQKNGSGH